MTITLGDDSATQTAALVLNGLDILMDEPDPVNGWRIHALGDDFTTGDPDAVINTIVSQLQDGDVEKIDRYGNRSATISLQITAPGASAPGAVIAAAQAAIDAACTFDGWAELTWISPLVGAEETVYEVTSATVSTAFDDLDEMLRARRTVTLTIHARPFVRGTTPISIDAPEVTGSTTTTVDDGSSLTNWSLISTQPAALKNLETNPDFKLNLVGYSAGANTSSMTWGTVSGRTCAEMQGTSRSYVNGPLLTAVAGETYEVGLVGDNTADAFGILVRYYSDTAGTKQIGSDAVQTAGGTAGWQTRSFLITAPTGAVRMRVYRFSDGGGVLGSPWKLDKQWTSPLADNSTRLGYYDGSTADTAALTYSWDGTVNNSTSTATWTAPTLAVGNGALGAIVYGRTAAELRRTNTGINATAMADLPYLRIKGIASPGTTVTLGDDGNYDAFTPVSYTMDGAGTWEMLVYRPDGFTTLDIKATRPGAVSKTSGIALEVASIEITDNPFGSAKTQSRQVEIYGSQRTELSLSVLGLDVDGTTPVGLGEQVLVHTAAAGSDGRAKFLNVRTTGTTSDDTAVSGYYDALPTTDAPLSFGLPAAALLPGNCLPVSRLRYSAAVSGAVLSYRALVTTAGEDIYDPRTGWKTVPLTVLASGAAWPDLNVNTWGMIPLHLLRLPPADIEDPDATITIEVACSVPVELDDIFLCNADVGQASILLTSTADGGSFSAARVDAATVDAPQPSGWVGVANGAMVSDAARWIGEQHQAAPGLLQIGTVTPGCATSRVSATYYARNHTNVMRVDVPGDAG